MAGYTKESKDYQKELKDLYDTGITDKQIDDAKQKQISPMPVKSSGSTPEPTFKSDVDNIVSGVKKVDRKINDTLDPVRKVMVKAAGKEEPGVLSKYSGLTKFVSEGKKKGGTVKTKKMASGGKVSQLAKANGCAVRGKSRGRII